MDWPASFAAADGAPLAGVAHLQQSIVDILRTPIGSRVMRRDYGSMLFALLDMPLTPAGVVEIIQAVATALARWEPRVTVTKVQVITVADGRLTVDLDLRTNTGAALTALRVVV